MKKIAQLFFAAVANVFIVAQVHVALADAIVSTTAMSATTVVEIFVQNDRVRMELEIGEADVGAFQNLLPPEISAQFQTERLTAGIGQLEKFFNEDLVLYADGKKLNGELIGIEARQRIIRDQITGEPMAIQPAEGSKVVYAVIVFVFSGFTGKFSIEPGKNQKGLQRANIGFITWHRGLPVMEFRYLGKKETLDLDWKDPWYSKFRNSNLRRQYEAPLSLFLYVENFEIRVEVVGRPADFQRYVDLKLEESVIPIAQQPEVKKAVAKFLEKQFELSVEGVQATPKLDRIHFIDRTLKTTGVVYPQRDLDVTAATLGAIWVLPTQKLPQEAAVKWRLFDNRLNKIPSVSTDEAGGFPALLTKDDPQLTWKNFLINPTIPGMLTVPPLPQPPMVSVPWASIFVLLAGLLAAFKLLRSNEGDGQRQRNRIAVGVLIASTIAAIGLWSGPRTEFKRPFAQREMLSEDHANQVLHSLMNNVYRSFDRREETLVYDQLATSVSGDLLRKLYLQMINRITLASQGGARVKIKEFQVLDSEFTTDESSRGFDARVRWNVFGQIGHWGHLHMRGNQYVADFSIVPDDGVWKIASMQIVDEEILGAVSQ